ncbi:MAG: phospholipase D-like domain-containing protein, partial [Vulcanimicrobiaceae bacterium]
MTLASDARFLQALGSARSAALCAYVLEPGGAVVRALAAAAQRGAAVRVELDGVPYDPEGTGALARENRRVAAGLRAAGASVELTPPGAPLLHLKGAMVDGTAFLDDRNWPGDGRDTIVETSDADDVAALGAALDDRPG